MYQKMQFPKKFENWLSMCNLKNGYILIT